MADATSTPPVKTVPKPRDQHLRDMADCIRFLSMDAVQQAKSGHPGAPMGMADIATVLFKDFMQFDAADPHWLDRDRFGVPEGHRAGRRGRLRAAVGQVPGREQAGRGAPQ